METAFCLKAAAFGHDLIISRGGILPWLILLYKTSQNTTATG